MVLSCNYTESNRTVLYNGFEVSHLGGKQIFNTGLPCNDYQQAINYIQDAGGMAMLSSSVEDFVHDSKAYKWYQDAYCKRQLATNEEYNNLSSEAVCGYKENISIIKGKLQDCFEINDDLSHEIARMIYVEHGECLMTSMRNATGETEC